LQQGRQDDPKMFVSALARNPKSSCTPTCLTFPSGIATSYTQDHKCLHSGSCALAYAYVRYTQAHVLTHRLICLHSGSCAYTQAYMPTLRLICLHSGSYAYTQAHVPTLRLTCLHSGSYAYVHYTQAHMPMCIGSQIMTEA
jgi:hypothetical protein